ncbi:MAG: short-chain dehydrogenase [Hyphomicrobiales bacterium]|nr:MAG: short-chain dehydrogenase [Hyphomicrobiales bacterium]
MSNKPLSGKTAIIAGGSGGVGKAVCAQMAQAGAKVVISYRNNKAGALEILASLEGEGHIALPLSIEDTTSINSFRDAALEAMGGADILVNTAGMTKPVAHSDLDGLTDEIIDEVFINNFRGVFATIRAFAPALKASGDATIVNVSSIAAFKGFGSSIAYCGAKAALDAMTHSLGIALGPEIRVMSVSPGVVDTSFVPGRTREFSEKAAAATPLQKVTEGEDVARAIMACVTHLSHSTGTRIIVDSGRSL